MAEFHNREVGSDMGIVSGKGEEDQIPLMVVGGLEMREGGECSSNSNNINNMVEEGTEDNKISNNNYMVEGGVEDNKIFKVFNKNNDEKL